MHGAAKLPEKGQNREQKVDEKSKKAEKRSLGAEKGPERGRKVNAKVRKVTEKQEERGIKGANIGA